MMPKCQRGRDNLAYKDKSMNEIIDNIVKKLNLDGKIIGILQYGSSLQKEDLDEFSDIDILIVIKDEYFEEQSRGCITLSNKQVEYFIETEMEIYKDFLDELDTFIPINRNRFLTGKILRDTDNKLVTLKERAYKMNSMPYTRNESNRYKEKCCQFFL